MNVGKNLIYPATIVIALALPLNARNKCDTGKGQEVFEPCAVFRNAGTGEMKLAPSLKGVFQHGKLKNGKEVADGECAGVIHTSDGGMPFFADKLSQDEKDNLIGWLHTSWLHTI